MARDCVICGKRTGSREHVFPAALGGRRTNKGIYCGKHNEGFSPLAAILANQLTAINALLGVRPDHADKPRPLATINPADGQAYLVSALTVELAEPRVVKDVTTDGVRQVETQFSSEEQVQQWLSEQRAAGNKVTITRREEGQGYFTRAHKVQLQIGGLEGLRAIGYVALTFLAHYFPTIARQPEIQAFKDFILGQNDDQPVWWDFNAPADGAPQNTFRFGHRILIGLSAPEQIAYARVSLFSTLDFAIYFGALPIDADKTVIVDIDPQAEHPPDDICEILQSGSLAIARRPASLTASLGDAGKSGEGQECFQRLLQRVSDWQRERIAVEMLPKIDAAKNLTARERYEEIRQLVRAHGQSVLNMMLHVVAGLKSQFMADPSTAPLAPALDVLVAEDPNSATGINQTATCALELAVTALAQQMSIDHHAGRLDVERLSLLMGGGPGAAIVGEAILRPFKMALGITM